MSGRLEGGQERGPQSSYRLTPTFHLVALMSVNVVIEGVAVDSNHGHSSLPRLPMPTTTLQEPEGHDAGAPEESP
eukprot:scaffold66323_cov19-Tisochrysis_lutea.AAC.1